MGEGPKRGRQMSRADLDRLIRGLGAAKSSPRIPRQPRTATPGSAERFPASFAQRRMWLLDRFHPGRATYNLAGAIVLEAPSGTLDPRQIASALGRLVGRHEVLRTRFAEDDGEPWQVVTAAANTRLALPRIDLTALDREARDGTAHQGTALHQELAWEARRPFDLAHGPLLRPRLWQLDAKRQVLQLTLHHSIADGWSLGVLLRELAQLLDPAQPDLPALPIQVADHAVWQREQAQSEAEANSLEALRQHLADIEPLELATDHRRPTEPTGRGWQTSIHLDREPADPLRALARQHGTTLFAVLGAALGAFLGRHGAADTVTLGFPVAGRTRRELEGLVGYFANTLVLKLDLPRHASLASLVTAADSAVRHVEEHQAVPFERVVEAVAPERSASPTPLFQGMLVFEAAGLEVVQTPELTLQPQELWTGTAKFDWTFTVRDAASDGGLRIQLEADRDLYERSTVERLLQRFGRLLRHAGTAPDTPWTQLDLLGRAEWHQLTWEWNGAPTTPELRDDASIPALLGRWAQTDSNRIAVVGEGLDGRRREKTYGELLARSRRLARVLRAHGVQRGDRVGVCLERTVDLVVALLGVLEAGAAYLPLDLAYPTERIAFMLADGGARCVVSQTSLADRLPAIDDIETLLLDGPAATEVATASAEPLDVPPQGDDLAYVIYTSGSTGRPKGVPIPHRNVVRLLSSTEAWYRFGPDDVWTFFHSHAFDFSVWEIWGCLATGGRLVVVPYWQSRSPEAMVTLLRDEGVTVLNQTPSAFRQLAAAVLSEAGPEPDERRGSGDVTWGSGSSPGTDPPPQMVSASDRRRARSAASRSNISESQESARKPGDEQRASRADARRWPARNGLRRLRSVIFGGEALEPASLGRWFARFGDTRPQLVNMYGITETTVHVTYRPLSKADAESRSGSPVGVVIPDQTLRVLDGHGRPAPLGVAGELHVGGAGLSWGYLGRPGLTAERFVPDPWGAPGARQYRSGDLARYLGDGELDFLGRIDHQVKVRGFRIELGEIESALLSLPVVGEAVVLARGEGADTRLVAWLVPTEGATVEVDPVREALTQRLPDYMVPSAFVVLDALPLTANGKLDRRALPEPDVGAMQAAFVAPRTPLEATVAQVFSTVLEVDPIGADDDFFHRGGHSVLAARVVARLSEALGKPVALRQLFEHSTVARLAAVLDQAQTDTADEDRVAAQAAAIQAASIPARGATRGPLSPGQERLWFLDQLDPGRPTYNIPLRLEITGSTLEPGLDPQRLESALRQLEQRHQILRTTYTVETEGDDPVQQVAPEASLRLQVVDLGTLPESQRREATEQWVADEVRRPFNLATGPVWRALLLLRGTDAATLVLTLHHIAADGASLPVLLREVATLYRGEPLPALPLQVLDHAAWQRQWLEADAATASLAWWRDHLADLPTLELPLDRPRPAMARQRGFSVPVALPPVLVKALEAETRSHGATLFHGVLALLATTLGRLTGQSELALGTPVANRPAVALEGLIGFLVNTLVLRLDLAADPTFGQLIERARDELLAGSAHQGIPFERVVQAVDPERDLAAPPLFQALLTYQELGSTPGLAAPLTDDLAWSASSPPVGTAKFDLTLGLVHDGTGMHGVLELDRDLFDRSTGERMARRLSVVLAAALATPDRSVWDLNVLSPGERHQLLWESAGPALRPSADTLVGRIGRRVSRRPDRVALIGADGSEWTYRALWHAACRLAWELHRRLAASSGAAAASRPPEPVIGLCLERTPQLVVAMLASQLAGAAYAPLDPSYPSERLAFILDDTASPLIVTQGHLRDRLPLEAGSGGTDLLDLDTDWERSGSAASEEATETASVDRDAPPIDLDADNLAYLIYTSGSTGRPKGVAISHRSALALVDWMAGEFFEDELGGVLAATSINFDLSIFEIFGTLARGGTVILAENALALPEHPAAERVRLINTVPSAMAELVSQDWLPHELVTVNLAGEPLRRTLVDQIHRRASEVRVLNLYGPSEDTTYSTWVEVPPGVGAEPTIGRPVAGTTAWVVDSRGRPVPLGAVGELVLGGAGLARGYLGRPARTARSFVPDGLGEQPGERLYRTGDRVRRRVDGELVFLGRFDHQVKVRGFRVELGEIEVALLAQPGVTEAVVLVLGEGAAARLVGCVAGADLDADTLRNALTARLPGPLVPTGWVCRDALPHLPNGKIDRRALATLAEDSAATGERSAFVAPRTAEEQRVAAIFSRVLGVEEIGLHDDFFALGGHSLLATRVVSRLRHETGLELPLRQLFEAPTVATLAAVLSGTAVVSGGQPSEVHDVSPQHGGESLPSGLSEPSLTGLRQASGGPIERLADGVGADGYTLSFSQERLWILDRLEPGNAAYNIAYSLRLRGQLDVGALDRSLAALLARHDGLRTRFEQHAGRPVQVVRPSETLPLLRADLRGLPAGRRTGAVRRLTQSVTLAPFDLSQSPLLRTALLQVDGEDHVLLFSVHHAVADGWSLGILTREIGVLYEAEAGDGSVAADLLPPLPVRYVDFAAWQRQWLVGDELERQLAYWRGQLTGLPQLLDLPTDQGRPAVREFRGGSLRGGLDAELGDALRHLARERGATVFMTLLAALEVLLGRLAGQEQFAIGSPVAGRNRSETEDVVGMFLNTLVLRADLEGDPTFLELLERTRVTALGAFDHQDVPFEKLLDELALERDLSRTPLFQVFFNMLNLPLGPLHLSALEIEPLELADLRSKFDLTLYVDDSQSAMDIVWVYNASLFSEARIERMLEQYTAVLEQIVDNPARRISQIALRTPSSWGLLPNPTEPLDATWRGGIHTWMAARAAERPDALAVESPEGSWTYAALAATSHRLAHRLLDAGLERGERVALVAHRSASLVWSVFGTLAAGGAFVLLDPAYPADRMVRILERARPKAILRLGEPALDPVVETTLRALEPRLDVEVPAWSALASAGPEWTDWPAEAPAVVVGPDDAAAIGFTSGSTGLPKGIVGRHGPLTHFLPWQCAYFDLGREDRYSMLSGLAHDPIQRDLFTPLATGATLCLPEPDQLLSSGYLARWLAEARVSVAHLTPAMAQVVSAGGEPGSLPALRRVFLTGDVLSVRDVERLERLAPDVRCVNFYGSTETQRAVGFRQADLKAEPGRPKEVLALGRGMEDVQLLVVGPAGGLAGVGELGEIWVRSPHLAWGYLDDPRETAEKFLVNPLGAQDGDDRVYRTGDLGRYRPDGVVEFAGRADQQVKIRGFRIELGEIVGALVRHPDVSDAAVLLETASESPTGSRRLVAYVVPTAAGSSLGAETTVETFDVEAVRSVLRSQLPDYMVPSGWQSLVALPLTPNGKLDRQALRAVGRAPGRGAVGGPAVQGHHPGEQTPQGRLQVLVAQTLRELLGVERVGLDDNFFDLGGNSLLLVELHGRLCAALGRDFAAVEIFQNPSVGALASFLAGLEGEGGGVAAIEPVASRQEQLKTGRDRLRQRRRRLTAVRRED